MIVYPKIFVDLDGTLADFHAKCIEVFGMGADEAERRYGRDVFWKTIRDYRNGARQGFFRSLDWMPDGKRLWDALKHLDPTILTGCPYGNWAPPQKVEWAADMCGPRTQIITCTARDKIKHLENRGDVLVDDKTKFQKIWEDGGGIFIHHTSAESSIEQLKTIYPIWFQRTDRWVPLARDEIKWVG